MTAATEFESGSPLTERGAEALYRLMAVRGELIQFVREDDADGFIFEGTARHFVRTADDFAFPRGQDDVRDCFLRITLISGMDVTLPVAEAARLVMSGQLAAVRRGAEGY